MGLLLSVLVACVGFVELVAFCSNVRRNYTRTKYSGLSDVTANYLQELKRERNRLLKQIQELESRQPGDNHRLSGNVGVARVSLTRQDYVGSCFQDDTTRVDSQQTNLDLHKDHRNLSSSTQKQSGESSLNNLPSFSRKTQVTNNLPDISLINGKASEDSASLSAKSNSFLSTERVVEESDRRKRDVGSDKGTKTLSRQESVNVYSVSQLDGSESVSHTLEADKGKKKVIPVYSESEGKKLEVGEVVVTGPEELSEEKSSIFGTREPSPFPTYDRLAPRNSICSELVENPTISVQETDEEGYSTSPRVEEYLTKTNFDSREFWNTKTLKVDRRSKSRSRSRTPEILRENLEDFEKRSREKALKERRRSKSETDALSEENSQLVDEGYWRRSVSPFQKLIDLFPDNFQSVDLDSPKIVEISEDLDSVDGLRHVEAQEEHKRQFKSKKNRKKGRKGKDVGSEDSDSGVVSVDGRECEAAGCSKKPEEPFWVKK